MSKLENQIGLVSLYEWASGKLKRPVREVDIQNDQYGFYVQTRKREQVPDNLQEICLLLNK